MFNLAHIFKAIDNFAKFPKGWNFGEGVPSSPVAVYQGKYILNVARNLKLQDIEVFPGVDGEIQLCFYDEKFTLEIVFEIDGTLSINLEKDDESIFFKDNAVINDAVKILKDFKYKKCHSYVSSTSSYIIVQGKNVYPAWRSDRHQLITVFPWSIGNVPSKQVKVSANTSRGSIHASREPRLSFGKFQMKKSPKSVTLSKV